jgi:hypothetical protein
LIEALGARAAALGEARKAWYVAAIVAIAISARGIWTLEGCFGGEDAELWMLEVVEQTGMLTLRFSGRRQSAQH